MADSVIAHRDGHVQVLVINRPKARNCIDADTSRRLGDALEAADHDPDVRAIVLTGAGQRAFCAGADLSALMLGHSPIPPEEPYASWGFAGFTRHRVSTPTIAAVNGLALGGGAEIVVASDLAVAADHAVLGFPEVRVGIFAAGGGAFRLPRQLPRKVALELLLTGQTITAERALDLHLVNRVVPGDRVLPTALELAREISRNAPLAVGATKRLAMRRAGHESADWDATDAEWASIVSTADALEGARAFVEKRLPFWTHR